MPVKMLTWHDLCTGIFYGVPHDPPPQAIGPSQMDTVADGFSKGSILCRFFQRANGPTGQRLRHPLTLACAVSLTAALLAPVRAQTLPSFTGTYNGGITSYTQPTPTTQEVFESETSTDATNGLDFFSAHEFYTLSGDNYFLTPGTTSTFSFSATDGSSVSGVITKETGFNDGSSQTFTGVCSISVGTGHFSGATGDILISNGNGNGSGSQAAFQVLECISKPDFSHFLGWSPDGKQRQNRRQLPF